MSGSQFKWRPGGKDAMHKQIAGGVANVCYAIEGTAKENTPVHGDPAQGGSFPTFVPGARPIGGTLRRSIHTVVYWRGQRLFASPETSGSGRGVGGDTVTWSEVTEGRGLDDIVGLVGTNVYYGLFVHDGTVKMGARPFLLFAMEEEMGNIYNLFMEGFKAAAR